MDICCIRFLAISIVFWGIDYDSIQAQESEKSGRSITIDDWRRRPDQYQGKDKVMVKNQYVIRSDKTVKNISPHPGEGFFGTGCIHPEGKSVVFAGAAWGNSRIWRFDMTSEQLKPLTPADYVSVSPSYSPDGKRIVFVADKGRTQPRFDMFEVGRSRPHNDGFKGGMQSASADLFIMDHDGSNIRRLTSGTDFDTRPSFSPDGRTIVFLSSREAKTLHLWTIPSDGESDPTKLPVKGNPWAGRPRYSPDGKTIYFFTGVRDGKYAPRGRHTLAQVPSKGGQWRTVANDTIGVSSHGPDPGPDGKFLWYHAAVDQLWCLYKLPLQGGKPVRFIPDGFDKRHVAHPTISRNGAISFDSRSFIESTR